MGEHKYNSVLTAKFMWFSALIILLGLLIASVYAAEVTVDTGIEYDGTNLPFENGDTVYIEGAGQIRVNNGMVLDIENCKFIFKNDDTNPDPAANTNAK